MPLVCAAVAFVAVTARLFVHPPIDEPRPADAIVVLAGGGDRLGLAKRLARQGLAREALLSNPGAAHDVDEGYGECRPGGTFPISAGCFVPDPATTRGEARAVARYADARGWSSVIVVASSDQAFRARMLVERCFDGRIDVAAVEPDQPILVRSVYEWGATARAVLLRRGC